MVKSDKMQRWTASLDVGEPRALTAASPGMVAIAGDRAAAAYDKHGARQWRVARAFLDARTLPDGRTILRTAEIVRVVDFLGEMLVTWSSAGRWAPQPFADEWLIDLDDAGVLTCSSYDGTLEWKAELGCRPLYPPTIAGREIVVADGSGLRLYDEHGRQRYRAELGGAASSTYGEGPILELAGAYVAPSRNATQGSSWYRWHAVQGDIEPFATGAAIAGPACVSGELFVAASPDTSDRGAQFVRAFSPSNKRVWELEVSRVVAITALSHGRVAVVSSPTISRWENYRKLQPVEDECRVTIVDRSGAVTGVHVVGAPLAAHVAYAGDLLYVVKRDTLVALAVG